MTKHRGVWRGPGARDEDRLGGERRAREHLLQAQPGRSASQHVLGELHVYRVDRVSGSPLALVVHGSHLVVGPPRGPP